MKYCPNCGTQCVDDANCCSNCGTSFAALQTAPETNPDDHTAEFSAEDVSKNKLYAVVAYFFDIFGLIIASICTKDSEFVDFHKRNALKLLIIEFISVALLLIPILGWIAFIAVNGVLLVLRVIAIIDVFCGKAKALPIIKTLKFLD